MKCPYCQSPNTRVVDTRLTEEMKANRRRRECLQCGKRFTTYERVEDVKLTIVKKDKRRESFDREKVRKGIEKACEKRPVSMQEIDEIVDEIESELRQRDEIEIEANVVGELVMEKLQQLDEVAYIRFASVYRRFTDIASFEKELEKLKVIKEVDVQDLDSTELLLLVEGDTREEITGWDRDKITKALVREAHLNEMEADSIASEVERKVFASGIKKISVDLIRSLVDNELFIQGYDAKLKQQKSIGMPTYDLRQLILSRSKENSNVVANNPEAVNLAIAESILKKFALQEIFSEEVSNAHRKGIIYLHDLGYPVRVYCSAHSLEYIKKYGLNLLNLSTVSSPARHASTLTGHLNTFLASMQAYYAGALGLAYVNIFYAPYFVDVPYKQIKQEAQRLIYSGSQNAFSRGGQTLFVDFNVHLGVPDILKNVKAIGPGGEYTGKTYADYEEEAQIFAKALMEVWLEGDSQGKVFPFPKLDLHVDQASFDDPKQLELLKLACKVASENGSTYFIFDRDEINLSMCCRLKTTIKDMYMIEHPESMRYCGFQNVSINLPQAAYRAGKGKKKEVVDEIKRAMDIAMKAHLEKKKFIYQLMMTENGTLWQIGKEAEDGRPYVDLEKATYILGIIGLNECVQYLIDEEMHESEEAYRLGLRIISAMNLHAKKLEEKHGLTIKLEETPGESAPYKLARTDLRDYPQSVEYVKGDINDGAIYYTNSAHFAAEAPIDIIDRITKQGKFNTLIESGSITHIFLGEKKPSKESILNLVKKTWDHTQSAQIVFSPEFTVCRDCGRVSRGYGVSTSQISDEPPSAHSPEVN
ncbi:anaerobic ribonucleoside-triphosphate reductase [Candidatus Heimdallarchaeota archaeon]|nr:MAG: anaerobic ribonucleoside-triphosphate reductase [Candidatus Heimdallarchaeota archaeon]